jgi:hypothetical protein
MSLHTAVFLGYIDPGSGSIIFQAVIAAAMALGLSGRLFWRRLTSVFKRDGGGELEEFSGDTESR